MNPWLQTSSGRAVDLIDPRPEDITIEDIAKALSFINRFTGHAGPMSVAQHSVMVSYLVPEEHALDGLMHDAHEAYCGDVTSPVKVILGDAWRTFEARMRRAVAQRFGVSEELPECVKHADLVALATEKREFLPHWPREWLPMPEPSPRRIRRWNSNEAEDRFRARFRSLGGKP